MNQQQQENSQKMTEIATDIPEITCGICQDLLPLVEDAVASVDSERAVKAHLQTCSLCEMTLKGKEQIELDETYVMEEILRKICVLPLFSFLLCGVVALELWKQPFLEDNILLSLVLGLGIGLFPKKMLKYFLLCITLCFVLLFSHNQMIREISTEFLGNMARNIYFYLILGVIVGKGILFCAGKKRKVRKNLTFCEACLESQETTTGEKENT